MTDVVTPKRLEFFIAAKLTNPLNGSHGHWSKRAKIARRHRDAVPMRLCELLNAEPRRPWIVSVTKFQPKIITFTLHVARGFDSDAWPAICKPFRDGCVDARLIHDDGPTSGHEFVYAQVKDGRRGVTVRVESA